MLRDDQELNEKIHSFLRRKETQYPQLAQPLTSEEVRFKATLRSADSRPYLIHEHQT